MKDNIFDTVDVDFLLASDFRQFIEMSFYSLHPGKVFKNSWHIDALSEALTEIEVGNIKKLIINIPPRSLKSFGVSIAWPAWLLSKNPSCRIIVASYSQYIAHKLHHDCRSIIATSWYQKLFPMTKIKHGCDRKDKFMTTCNGFRIGASVRGRLTGEGADVIIIDDPMSPLQASSDIMRQKTIHWFQETLVSRLDNIGKGAMVLVMQRLHRDDLSGFLLSNDSEWMCLKVPIVSNIQNKVEVGRFKYERKNGELLYPLYTKLQDIEKLKDSIGEYAFAAQYQQEPILYNDGIIKKKWIKYYDLIPNMHWEKIFQSWDCAVKATSAHDYTVCTTWGMLCGKCYLINVFREKLEYPYLKEAISALYNEFKPISIIIEDKAAGQQLLQELKRDWLKDNGIRSTVNIIGYNPKYDKKTRLMLVSPMFERGLVLIPKEAAWLQLFEEEFFNFPCSKHDDQVDSTTQFFLWLKEYDDNIQFYNSHANKAIATEYDLSVWKARRICLWTG